MNSININLTGKQVLEICNALNTEAQRLEALVVHRRVSTPLKTVQIWKAAAERHYAMSRQLIRAGENDKLNPHVPVTLVYEGDGRDDLTIADVTF